MIKKVLIYLLLFILILIFIYWAFASDDIAGFCKAQNRIIPKEEFYARTLSSDFNRGFIKKDTKDITIHDYIKSNPNCCVIEYNAHRDNQRSFDNYYKGSASNCFFRTMHSN